MFLRSNSALNKITKIPSSISNIYKKHSRALEESAEMLEKAGEATGAGLDGFGAAAKVLGEAAGYAKGVSKNVNLNYNQALTKKYNNAVRREMDAGADQIEANERARRKYGKVYTDRTQGASWADRDKIHVETMAQTVLKTAFHPREIMRNFYSRHIQ